MRGVVNKCSYVTHLASHSLLGSWVKTDGNRNICYYFYPLVCSSICYKWTRVRTAMDCIVFPNNLSGLLWDLVYLKVFPASCYFLQRTACLTFLQVPIQRYALHTKNKWLHRAWRECWSFQAVMQVPKDSAEQGRGSRGTRASLLELSRRTTLNWLSVEGKTLNSQKTRLFINGGRGTRAKVSGPTFNPLVCDTWRQRVPISPATV